MSVMIRAALTTVTLTAAIVASGGVVASANTGSASSASSAAASSTDPFKDCRFATSSGTAIVNVTATAMVSTYSSIQHRTIKVRRTVTLKKSVKVSVPSIVCVGTHKSSVKVYVLIGG
jgi:hypothetical protein